MKMMKRNKRSISQLRSNCGSRRKGNATRSRRDMRKHVQELWALIREALHLELLPLRLDRKMGRAIEARVEVGTVDRRVDDPIANLDPRNFSIQIIHRSQAYQYKSAMEKLLDQGHQHHEMKSKSYARQRDQTEQAGEDSGSRIGVGKRVDSLL
jgi:hypothetical protein